MCISEWGSALGISLSLSLAPAIGLEPDFRCVDLFILIRA